MGTAHLFWVLVSILEFTTSTVALLERHLEAVGAVTLHRDATIQRQICDPPSCLIPRCPADAREWCLALPKRVPGTVVFTWSEFRDTSNAHLQHGTGQSRGAKRKRVLENRGRSEGDPAGEQKGLLKT